MALQPLFRLGGTPVAGAAGGVKSLLAFWMGGACAPTTTVTPPAVGLPARRYVDLKKRHRAFSRKYFEELQAAEQAQYAALIAADKLATSKRKTALAEAAQLAEAALDEIDAAESAANEAAVVRMTAALQAAASATLVKDAIAQARIAQTTARTIITNIEDEEDAILLLLH